MQHDGQRMTTKVPRNTKSELGVAAVKLGLVKTISHLFFFSLAAGAHSFQL
jgi:hypothetical protein